MSRVREIALGERHAVVSFLRRLAKGDRAHAQRLLADTQQAQPEAQRWVACADTLDEAATRIEQEHHWR